MSFNHTTVLLDEAVDGLNIKPDGIYVDATLGGGGHTKLIASQLTSGKVFSFDQDEVSIKHNQEQFASNDSVVVIHDNFVNAKEQLLAHGVEKIDGIIFDLGVSSVQIDDAKRGFSYMHDARLDMRMNQEQDLDAWQVVNTYDEAKLCEIFQVFGEEKFAKQIAKQIVTSRNEHPIDTTLELVEIIKQAIPKKFYYQLKSHPAKKVFQALRIYVNQELSVFSQCLEKIYPLLNIGGRISVITFHSLEDKICKYFFKQQCEVDPKIAQLPIIPEEYQPQARLVNNKPILPSKDEIEANSRAKSAKLRILEKIR